MASVGADKTSAELSNEDKARAAAAKIEFARMATESLAKVAAALAKAGLTADAEATIELVQHRLGKARVDYDTLAKLVEALARLGKFDEALSFAKGNDYPYIHGQTLTTVAIHLAYAGRLSQGLDLLLPLPPYERHLAIRRFAWALRYAALERGEEAILIEALRVVEKHEHQPGFWKGVRHVSEFPPPLLILAEPLAETGRFDEAWRLIVSTPKNRERAADLAELAILQIRIGGIAACLRALSAVEDGQLRSDILRQALEGLVSQTWLARTLSFGYDDTARLRPPRAAGTTAEDLAEALKLARAFPHNQERDFALGMVAAALMQSEASSDAWSTARSILDKTARHLAFRIVGRAEAMAGREAEAKAAYAEAVASGKTIDCEPRRQRCETGHPLISLAAEMARAGLVKEALAVLETTTPRWPDVSTSVHYAMAQGYVRLGAVDDALAAGVPGKNQQGYGIGRYGIVAFELAKSGRIAEAISLANQAPRRAADMLRIIAKELTAAGRYQQAQQIIEAMQNAEDKVFALAAIGWNELRAGQHSNAKEMFVRAMRALQAERQPRVTSFLHIAASMDTEPVSIKHHDSHSILLWLEDFVGREYRPGEPPHDKY